MSYMIEEVFLRVQKLSDRINKLYNINPIVDIAFFETDALGETFGGLCIVSSNPMYIVVSVPYNIELTSKNVIQLDVTLIHEYCHYREELVRTRAERQKSASLYIKDSRERAKDERKAWRNTKKMAKLLGLWSRPFFREIKTLPFSSNLTYN